MKVLVLLATAVAVASSSIAASASSSDRASPIEKVDKAKVEAPKLKAAKTDGAPSAKALKRSAKGVGSKKTASAKMAAQTRKKTSGAKVSKPKPRLVAKARKSEVVIDRMETASTAKPTSGGRAYGKIVSRYSATYGVPSSLAHAVIRVESNYRVDALGRAGEIGLMQIKPSTARMLGYSGSAKGLYDPETNIKYGLMYLGMAHKLGGRTTCGTILRYNAGHAATRMNPVSAAYCSKVKRHLAG